MLIPYGTDAPVNHFPWSTIALIVVNVLLFGATVASLDSKQASPLVMGLCLQYDRIQPTQWLTNNFMHAGLLHLLGNMLFLWVFGLVVEGKLGWWKFLLLYLLMGTMAGALEQLTMFYISDGQGFSLGASGVIYGMIALAMMWAPKNDIHCMLFLSLYPRMFDLPILSFAALYLAMQAFFFWLGGFRMSSEALHLTGFAVGVPFAWLLWYRRWVDCEGWDLWTLYFTSEQQRQATREDRRTERLRDSTRQVRDEHRQQQQQISESIQQAVDANNSAAALAIYRKYAEKLRLNERLPPTLLAKLIGIHHGQQQWEASIPMMVVLLSRVPGKPTIAARLKLAQILLQVTDQPKQAVAVLRKLPAELDAAAERHKRQLLKIAKTALQDGSLEADIQDW